MNEDLIDLFLEESREIVLRAQDDLDALDANLTDVAVLDSLFRAVHTLKGSVAIFDWTFFAQMLHAAEDLLSAARKGEKTLNAESIAALDACIRKTQAWLDVLETERAFPPDCALEAAMLAQALQQALLADDEFFTPEVKPRIEEASSERRTMRVDVERIDALVHTVDELVVAKNALLQLALESHDKSGQDVSKILREHQATIGRLTVRMHAAVTAMRLVPITPALRRLPRMARDLGARLGKPVEVVLECDEIEADKAVVDGLSEPLLHLVRNALDHGVEPTAERRAAGKPERARITIAARRNGDQVQVSVTDDGPGINPARIREVARERQFLPAHAIDALDDREVVDLIFSPGFSTANQVSEISGRGVGMDAVRSAVGRLGGRTEVSSTPGQGTSITLTLPLSMVLSQIAVVSCDGDAYGVPMNDIVELARVDLGEISEVRHGKAFFLRDRAVPIISLERLLGRPERNRDSNVRVLVMRSGDEWIGVSVQRLLLRMEAVVSPIAGLLSGMKGFGGTAIMGDGAVLIILDLPELIG